MKQKWLNKQNNSKLIVFFNGWGMDEQIINNLAFDDYDVFAVSDYRSFEEIKENFNPYSEKNLICWSMGVFTSNYYYEQLKDFDNKIAVNGTQNPIDDNFGIPIQIYNLMIDNFNELTVKRFMKKMTLSDVLDNYQSRTDESLKEELISIKNLKITKYLDFNKVLISTKDKIIPVKNQRNYWISKKIEPIETELPHYIFDKYSKWSELL